MEPKKCKLKLNRMDPALKIIQESRVPSSFWLKGEKFQMYHLWQRMLLSQNSKWWSKKEVDIKQKKSGKTTSTEY